MRTPLIQAALLCLTVLCSSALQARVEVEAAYDKRLGTVLAARISEDIAPGDYEALLKGLRANPGRYERRIVLLDSIGGSAPEAMRMGRLLRETRFDVLVPRRGVCQGSCIYLLAAGHKKTVRGHVGLHRPPFAGGDSAQAQAVHRGEHYSPSAYFREMNIPGRLAEEMQRIAPHNMRLLDPEQLARYRLN
ncbi:hypothetical protein I0D00_15710 [Pseudomonas lalucatii]|uniref:Periplasmic protein-like protein n=1 Tax=Pseudomonas lalucatii TaxID=1424203 RepID=A0ABS5Q3N0_9PSED|nr:hypothetical protein [Pseudomonas lalucatii]MBS7663375.1 hypothetical protein [Pseudomonas lalucatii]MBS7689874.1 hypothetical protein [Pseudomonas lalucatii]